jgi:hypothetical protein
MEAWRKEGASYLEFCPVAEPFPLEGYPSPSPRQPMCQPMIGHRGNALKRLLIPPTHSVASIRLTSELPIAEQRSSVYCVIQLHIVRLFARRASREDTMVEHILTETQR